MHPAITFWVWAQSKGRTYFGLQNSPGLIPYGHPHMADHGYKQNTLQQDKESSNPSVIVQDCSKEVLE